MKIVLTGGPSCGKSSVLEYFKKEEQRTVDEIARQIIEERGWKNKTLTNKEFNSLEEEICKRSIDNEWYADVTTSALHFFDRSLIDVEGYFIHRYGHVPKKYINFFEEQKKLKFGKHKDISRYHRVYILDRLPLINDGLRLEKSEEEAQKMHECILKAYELRGYDPIRVPLISAPTIEEAISKRGEFIKSDLLGLHTIDEEYEKIQSSYAAVRGRYNLPIGIKNYFEKKRE